MSEDERKQLYMKERKVEAMCIFPEQRDELFPSVQTWQFDQVLAHLPYVSVLMVPVRCQR